MTEEGRGASPKLKYAACAIAGASLPARFAIQGDIADAGATEGRKWTEPVAVEARTGREPQVGPANDCEWGSVIEHPSTVLLGALVGPPGGAPQIQTIGKQPHAAPLAQMVGDDLKVEPHLAEHPFGLNGFWG